MKFLFVALGVMSAAHGAERPVIGPAPAWVRPVVRPAEPKADEAPIRFLLSDQQIAMEQGRTTVYSELVFKIQTPQGLAAGNISLPWRPDTDVLTVHKLGIRRGGQFIDVLASGQTFTVVRREQNLESATLDGVLTATMQPEGLQVGDVVELAMSLSASDPVMKGHVEEIMGAWNGLPIGRAHLRMQWPDAIPMRLRQTASIPLPKPVRARGLTSVELSLDDVQPVIAPKGAPLRYRIGRLVEATDYMSWADIAALMVPLYDKAAVLPAEGPLRVELNRITALSPDPKRRAEAALALVQDRVRYVALAMGAGGYVPADAETSWSRRFGDCKGKTALLIALLHAMDIQAEPVLVSTVFGDGLDARLPMVGLFDHVLVRATIAGRTYWLDGTRMGDTSLERLAVPAFGWGLPLIAKGATLVRMVPDPFASPMEDTAIRIDARAGISVPAPTTIETVMHGDGAFATNAGLTSLVGETRDRALKAYWKNQYDFIDVKSVTASFDPKTGDMRLTMTGEAKLDWANGNYQTDGTDVGYRADFVRDAGPDKDAPFAVPYPYFTRVRETILLPKGPGMFKLGPNMEVDQTAGGIAYRRHATITGDMFTIEKTERSVVPEFAAKDAPAEQAALRALAERRAGLRMPGGYRYTDKDIASIRANVPTTSAGYLDRAKIFGDRNLPVDALLDYDKAVALDPGNGSAWANRATARVAAGDITGANSDLAKAEALDPDSTQIRLGRAMLAERDHRPKDAIDGYTRVLEREPGRTFAIGHRAFAYAVAGDDDHALADAAAAIRQNPRWIELYLLRAQLFLTKDDREQAFAEMRSAIAVDPAMAFAHVAAGRIYAAADRRADAVKEYDQAILIEPTAAAYAERSNVRPFADKAARRADIDMALKLDPKSSEALSIRALFQAGEGDPKAAIASWSEILAASPGDPTALQHRAGTYRSIGDYDRALVDADAALKQDPKSPDLHLLRANILRSQGRREEGLREAATLQALNPDNAYAHVVAANLYSAFHKDPEAMKAYDRALAIKPEAYIYVNRGLRRPKTDVAGRRADMEAALKLQPDMDDALVEKARLQAEGGDAAGAVATYSSALVKAPDKPMLLTGRGMAYVRGGDTARAERDFTAARAKAVEPETLNNMCWEKATAGIALESALGDCDAALAKAPGAASYLDSRGLVLLRLGRLDAAIADYDRALAKYGAMSSSLFGRAVAWGRKGNKAKADADAASAVKIDPDVRARFARYGVKP